MQLSVNGTDTFIATGGKPFDPSLPAVVMIHGAGPGTATTTVSHRVAMSIVPCAHQRSGTRSRSWYAVRPLSLTPRMIPSGLSPAIVRVSACPTTKPPLPNTPSIS